LIDVVGLDRINETTRGLGLLQTRITSNLRDMLDELAREAGFASYVELAAHEPAGGAPLRGDETLRAVAASAALDPTCGTRTTASETVTLLKAIWSNRAGPPQACAAVRHAMERQLTRHRIASGFGPGVSVAAKSGGLVGIVRNEAGIAAFPDGAEYGVAIFTRAKPGAATNPALIDAAIGRIACVLIDQLRTPLT
jgi:beta-lactamase class A